MSQDGGMEGFSMTLECTGTIQAEELQAWVGFRESFVVEPENQN